MRTSLTRTSLTRTSLTRTSLTRTSLIRAGLTRTSLMRASLNRARRIPARLTQRCLGPAAELGIPARDHDRRAFGQKPLGDREADAGRAAGDQRAHARQPAARLVCHFAGSASPHAVRLIAPHRPAGRYQRVRDGSVAQARLSTPVDSRQN